MMDRIIRVVVLALLLTPLGIPLGALQVSGTLIACNSSKVVYEDSPGAMSTPFACLEEKPRLRRPFNQS